MERSQVLDAMGQLKLYGMRTAYDEIIATAVKRQHEPQQIIGDLLTAEISESEPLCAIGSRTMASARSIKYQMTIAKLPLAKEIKEFDFEAAEVNETLIRDLATGDFLDHQRNLVLVGGTGTGKTHLAVSIARACIRNGRRGRFLNVVDLVNKLDAEARAERHPVSGIAQAGAATTGNFTGLRSVAPGDAGFKIVSKLAQPGRYSAGIDDPARRRGQIADAGRCLPDLRQDRSRDSSQTSRHICYKHGGRAISAGGHQVERPCRRVRANAGARCCS